MPAVFRFALNDLPPEAESLRAEVREFLRKEFSGTGIVPDVVVSTGGPQTSGDAAFQRAVSALAGA